MRLILLLMGVMGLHPFGSAHGGLLQETWTATVSSLGNSNINSVFNSVSQNGFSIGETASWTVTYDTNRNDRVYYYLDGPDGESDRGLDDDIVSSVRCVDSSVSNECDGVPGDDLALYQSRTDASSVVSRLVGFLDSRYTVFDYFDFNHDHRIFRSGPHGAFTQHDYYSDYFVMYADNRLFPAGGAGYASLFYKKDNDETWQLRVGFSNISYSAVEINEPSILKLVLVGILGIGLMQAYKMHSCESQIRGRFLFINKTSTNRGCGKMLTIGKPIGL